MMPMTSSDSSASIVEPSGPYELFVLVLSAIALLTLAGDTLLPLGPSAKVILGTADFGICLLFFFDFLYQLWRAPSRGRYFITWGWLDLLSSIPFVEAFRLGRVGRIVRIVRVLRGVRSTRRLASYILQRRAQSTFLAVVLVSFVLLLFSSAAIMQFETVEGSNIKSAQDALWWAFVTITTVGYGDRFPVTPEGRLIGALLMTAGVGLFGTFSGFIASWFLTPGQKEEESELSAMRAELAEIKALLQAQRST